MEEELNPFSQVDQEASPFESIAVEPSQEPIPALPNKTLIMTLAKMDPTKNPGLQLQEENIEAARQLLESGREYEERTKIAGDRLVKELVGLGKLKEEGRQILSKEQLDSIDTAYQTSLTANIESRAKASLEEQALDNIEDMASRDPVQARIMLDNYQTGGAVGVKREWQLKMMALAQLSEAVDNEYEQSGWGRGFFNGLIGLIPTFYNQSRSGIVDFANENILDNILIGNATKKQSEAFYNLPLEEFIDYVKVNGALHESIKANASSFGIANPTQAKELLNELKYQSEDDRLWANAWGVLDPATAIPGRLIAAPTKLLARAAARKEAVDLVVSAADKAASQGLDVATKSTGLTEDAIAKGQSIRTVDMSAGSSHSVPLAVDVQARQDAVKDYIENRLFDNLGTETLSPDELADAVESTIRQREKIHGRAIKDYALQTESLPDGRAINKVEWTFGKKDGGGYANEANALNAARTAGLPVKEAFRDESGQWFVRGQVNINPTDFFVDTLHQPTQGFIGRLTGRYNPRSSANTTDRGLFGKAVQAESAITKASQSVGKDLRDSWARVPKNARPALEEILAKGGKEKKWYSESELRSMLDAKGLTREADKIVKGYNEFRFFSDVDYAIRNDLEYSRAIADGYESAVFKAKGLDVDADVRINYSPDKIPSERSFNLTDNVHYEHGNALTSADIDRLRSNGYVMMTTKEAVQLPDGTTVRTFWAKKSDVDISPLRRQVLPYSPGGHRMYKDKVFVKQGRKGVQADTGSAYLLSPRTYRTASNIAEARAWAETMDAARLAVKEGSQGAITRTTDEVMARKILEEEGQDLKKASDRIRAEIDTALNNGAEVIYRNEGKDIKITQVGFKDSKGQFWGLMNLFQGNNKNYIRVNYKNANVDGLWLDDNIFKGDARFPTGEDFIDNIKKGNYDLDEAFEAVYDRQLPSSYTRTSSTNVAKFFNEDEQGFNGFYREIGRMYTSGKGDTLKHVNGELAEVLDPYEATMTSLRNVVRNSSLYDYRQEAVERWVNTFKDWVDIPAGGDNKWNFFMNAAPKAGLTKEERSFLELQRDTIKNNLGLYTPLDSARDNAYRQAAEYILGNGDSTLRVKGHDVVNWVQEKNPVNFLRGMAFDAKLGMFNPAQMLLQISTGWSAIAMSPKYGLKAGVMPMHSILISRGSVRDSVIDILSKRGTYKSMGFESVADFKDYIKFVTKSGFADLDGTHLQIGHYGSNKAFGTFGESVENFRNKGRVFFYSAETYNRLIAMRIGYGQALDEGLKKGTSAFNSRVMQLSSDYSFNMDSASKSFWQSGLLSIPTQFWSYNLRMMDAMFGSKFTAQQRMRLAAFNFALAGTAGVPIMGELSDMLKDKYGTAPDVATLTGALDRGFLDRMMYEISGQDIRFGERYGTGGWVTQTIKDAFGYSEYGEKSFADIAGGATYSIWKNTFKGGWDAVKYAAAESGGDMGSDGISGEGLINLAKEISTIGNAYKAYLLYNYGYYKSQKGTVLQSNLPQENAFATALGFRPQALDTAQHASNFVANESEAKKEFAKRLRDWRQEAFNNPDKYEENMKKSNALIQLIPQHMRQDIIRQTNNITDPSFYDRIARKADEIKVQKDMVEQ